MIVFLQRYFAGIKPMFLDGFLYCAIAVFGAASSSFGSDEAAKYVSDVWLFWLRSGCGTISAGLLALKMYRSTSYADHVESVRQEQIEQKKQ